jgi:predicted glycosyltransferase
VRILVDITHPAHVHFFRNAIDAWRQRGHTVLIASREKDITIRLLDEYGYEHFCLSKARRGVLGLLLELLEHQGKLLQLARHFQPDVVLEIGGTFIVHVAKLLRTPALVFYDTENARVSNAITYPFADTICTPSCYQGDLGRKHVRYDGYQELAYLHPSWFTPDERILDETGLSRGEPFSVVRFVGWSSGHDVNLRGFSLEGKTDLIRRLGELGRVIITSESPLPRGMDKHRMDISPVRIHDLLFFARLCVGESATMASESALLGTPFIFVSPVGRGYTEEQEKAYGLGHTISPEQEERAIDLAVELAQHEGLCEEWQARRRRLLEDKIDVTAWLVDFVERYPETLVEHLGRSEH